jgi:hypothetical protein
MSRDERTQRGRSDEGQLCTSGELEESLVAC